MVEEQIPKIKYLKIIACPEGCRKKFDSVMALNNHLTKKHQVSYSVSYKADPHAKGRFCTVRTLA